VVRQLESAGFGKRFERLSIPDSRRALVLMKLIRRQAGPAALVMRMRGARAAELEQDLRRAYAELIALLGSEVSPATDGALRELAVTSGETRLRILFGLDFPRQQGLLVLGERLDRRFYGDSIRRALRQWERFQSGDRDAFQFASVAG